MIEAWLNQLPNIHILRRNPRWVDFKTPHQLDGCTQNLHVCPSAWGNENYSWSWILSPLQISLLHHTFISYYSNESFNKHGTYIFPFWSPDAKDWLSPCPMVRVQTKLGSVLLQLSSSSPNLTNVFSSVSKFSRNGYKREKLPQSSLKRSIYPFSNTNLELHFQTKVTMFCILC
jgi:hypothetical protein